MKEKKILKVSMTVRSAMFLPGVRPAVFAPKALYKRAKYPTPSIQSAAAHVEVAFMLVLKEQSLSAKECHEE
jgi:hypothetical protein